MMNIPVQQERGNKEDQYATVFAIINDLVVRMCPGSYLRLFGFLLKEEVKSLVE